MYKHEYKNTGCDLLQAITYNFHLNLNTFSL